ncbi:CHAT domain-containing protein [Nonomuraea sp. NPDC049714]|uniref:CHAT domain-containing protein n=1 Tax=Nonomuraea sp. NPDC049714 TaxID=3364357 RepID=UPI0037AC5E2F
MDATELVIRFEWDDDNDALDQAIALRETDGGAPYGMALLLRHHRRGAREDLERAVTAVLADLDGTSREAPERADLLVDAADALMARWDADAGQADVDTAVDQYREAVELTPESARARSKLGMAIARRRLLGGGGQGDLAEALTLCRQAVDQADRAEDSPPDAALGPDALADRAARLDRLALVTSARAVESQDQDLARTAVDTVDAVLRMDLGRGLLLWGPQMTRIAALGQRYALTGRPEHLTAVIAACRSALESMPADWPHRRHALLQYGVMTAIRFYEEGRDPADRDRAIGVLREALGDPRPGLSLYERSCAELLRKLLWNRMSDGARLDDVDDLVARLRAALVDTPGDEELREDLYKASRARFTITGDQDDLPRGDDLEDERERVDAQVFKAISGSLAELDAAVSAADRLLDDDHDDGELDGLRISLSGALTARYAHRGDRRDLDRGLSLQASLLDGVPAGSPLRGHLLLQMAGTRTTRYDATGDRADLDAALAGVAEAAGIIGVDHVDRRMVEHVIGRTRVRRYRRDGDPADLESAIAAYRTALDAAPVGHPVRREYAAELSEALQERARIGGAADNTADDNTAAIEAARSAVRLAPPGDQRALARLPLARAMSQRFLLTGDVAAIRDSIAAFQEAAAELPPDHPVRALALGGLAEVLKLRAELTGSQTDLNAAVTAGEQAWRQPVRAADRAMIAIYLTDALRMRGQRVGGRADVDAAMDVITSVLADLAHTDPWRPLCELQLAVMLSQRFLVTGDAPDVDRCVEIVGSVLAALPAHSPWRRLAYETLSENLWKRAQHRGDLDDLDDAIDAMDLALAVPTSDHRHLAVNLYNKAGMLGLRFDEHARPEDLDGAIEAGRAALAALPAGHYYRPVVSKGLSLLYLERPDANSADDLSEIIGRGREALAATAEDDPSWASQQHLVGVGRLLRFGRTGRARDLRSAIRAIEASVAATPPGDPALGSRAAQLGLVLNVRYERRGRRRDRDRAMDAYRLAASVTSNGTLSRLESNRDYAAYTLRHGRPVEALEHYRICVQDLLPLVTWRGLGRRSQENQLKRVAGLAGDAAAAALACDSPRAAVQLLEQGRSVLWAQLLQTRSDRSELHAGHPRLAAEFDEVSAALDLRSAGPLRPGELTAQGGADRMGEAERRRRATARFTELIDYIRELPGFAGFLRPPDIETLLQAADRGPVVIVNVGRTRCDALLLTTEGVRTLPLPGLTQEEAVERATAFHDALGAARQGLAARINANQTMLSTLEWLWEAVALPVLDALALPVPDATALRGGNLPRVWWCPTGPLATLPLHAAGRHRPGANAAWVGDHVVSSYTPTLQALLRARTERPAPPAPAALVTGLRVTPRQDGRYRDLPAVPDEIRAIRDTLGGRALVLEDATATWQAVLDAVPAHPWVHFACHGKQNPQEPSASHLALHDADLTVLDLVKAGVVDGDLAFLSACETAQGDTTLTDEAIHLAAAFHLAGYRHVIGTLWSLNDASAARVAADVYGTLAGDSGTEPAVALHLAVARLRALPRFRSPLAWAPYVHIGA